MRAAVTGGAGFIGSNLVDALVARGDNVVVIDDLSFGKREFVNPAAELVVCDIRDGVDLQGAEVVFHLAAQTDVQTSVRDPARDADVNVVGTVKVLEAARLGDLRRSALDVSAAASWLGFRARTPLAEGIALTWAWATG